MYSIYSFLLIKCVIYIKINNLQNVTSNPEFFILTKGQYGKHFNMRMCKFTMLFFFYWHRFRNAVSEMNI